MKPSIDLGRTIGRPAAAFWAMCAIASAQIAFDSPISYPAGTEPHAVVLADFDGDLDLDIVATVHSPAGLNMLRNLGDGTFAAPAFSPLSTGTDPVGLVARDFNSDGHIDVVVAQSGTDVVKYFRNLVDGYFVPGDSVNVGDRPELMAAGDFDGDGDDDIAVANRDGDSVSFVRNLGGGDFARIHTLSVGAGPRGIAVGQFDEDAFLDVVVACHGARRLDVLKNDGTGTFTRELSLPFGTTERPEDVVAADFDGDGDDDLVTTLGDTTVHHIGVFRQIAPGVFCQCDYLPTGGQHPAGLCAADFDLDTRLDLAIAHSGSDEVSVLPNTVDPLFGTPLVYAVLGPESDFVAAADLDGNHYVDLVVTDDLGDTVTVLLNARDNPSTYCVTSPNSAGPGARIGWFGAHSIAANEFNLTVVDSIRFTNGLFFYGVEPTQVPYFSGQLCVSAPLARLGPPVQADEMGDASRWLDFTAPPAAFGPMAITAGTPWNFQFWYRDAPTTNFSDGLRVVFEP